MKPSDFDVRSHDGSRLFFLARCVESSPSQKRYVDLMSHGYPLDKHNLERFIEWLSDANRWLNESKF